MTYKDATPFCPFAISASVSSAKEENVVKPPQIPTFKNSTSLGLSEFFAATAATRPMTKAPMTLIRNVLNGNPFSGFIGSRPIR